jgi:hypothetical protein
MLIDVVDNNYELFPSKSNQDQEDEEEYEGIKNKKEYCICKYSQGISSLAEAVLVNNIPYFLQIKNNDGSEGKEEPVLLERIDLSDITILPPERTSYISREYSFESIDEIKQYIQRAKEETWDTLFLKVKSTWKKYVDADDDFINICAADTIFTCFQDKLGMTHYLLFIGDNGTGKSNILFMFSLLGYRPLNDTSITPANIYNFCSPLEEGQGIILEDEVDNIEYDVEKMKLYKVSYRSGTKVTRLYDANTNNNNNKGKSQQSYFIFCFKAFASEKIPSSKAKGFLERILVLKAIAGSPTYDISEIVNDAGDETFIRLRKEIEHLRKLLLIYRILHYEDSFPDIKLNVKNRNKQLAKPLLRLFNNAKTVRQIIIDSLSTYIFEKQQKKTDSLEAKLLEIIKELIRNNGPSLTNEVIWNKVKEELECEEIPDKRFSCYCEEFGLLSKTRIALICKEKFHAKKDRKSKERGLIFDKETLERVSDNYSVIEKLEILDNDTNDTYDSCDTFTEDTDQYNDNNPTKDASNT